MKFLADEDYPKPLTVKIRQFGHSVKTIQQKNLRGSSDEFVTHIALKDRLIVLTLDKGFPTGKPGNLKVVVFHFPKIPTSEILPLIEKFLRDLMKHKFKAGEILQFNKNGLEIIK